jgi:hypothetical protein
MTPWPHRIQQFVRSLRPVISTDERQWIQAQLTPAEYQLYAGMSLRDQRHCLDVTQTALRRYPDASPALLKLTLLHDAGKQLVPFRLWERVLVVLWPRRHPLPPADPLRHDWQRPWQLKYRHPEYGARLAAAAGCDTDLVANIRQHHDAPAPNPVVAAFQWADDRN